MEFRTEIHIDPSPWHIRPADRLLFVGSCFAANMGQRFADSCFSATVNPQGVMYNPASILHTLQRMETAADVAVLTLGTNRVYVLNETGEIVDNCQKRPQRLFTERPLTVGECARALQQCARELRRRNPEVHIIVTVSPIRYAKYGFHGSQLSKSTLLLAADEAARTAGLSYFPAYEIVNDELRDYRFYRDDMLHPTDQAVEYIYERFADTYFAPETHRFVEEYRPIRQALAHRFFNPDSEESRRFRAQTLQQLAAFKKKWGVAEE